MVNKNNTSMSERIVKLEHEVEQIKVEIDELKPLQEQSIRQDEQYKQIIASLTELKDDVKSIKGRSSKFWDYSITAIIAAVIGFIVSKFLGV